MERQRKTSIKNYQNCSLKTYFFSLVIYRQNKTKDYFCIKMEIQRKKFNWKWSKLYLKISLYIKRVCDMPEYRPRNGSVPRTTFWIQLLYINATITTKKANILSVWRMCQEMQRNIIFIPSEWESKWRRKTLAKEFGSETWNVPRIR
jgi:hypothetical protein